jgi:hypothetical protein
MNFLDKIALNRLIKIITNFIITILKIFAPKDTIDIVPPVNPPSKPLFPRLRKKIDNVFHDTNEES